MMEGEGQVTRAPAFFGKTYGEALALLAEVRDWLAEVEPQERRRLDPLDRLLLCRETMRLTARLTQVMAWLLAQRAVQEGEITQDEALLGHEALATLAVCMEEGGGEEAALPPPLVDLLERSRRLYVRVARLDELARRPTS
jgi:regulator of CtrA degradation